MTSHKSDREIYLLGNPNCGKTSLFNAITGEKRRVGNWPGVTVQKIQGVKKVNNTELLITDLPGTYSLSPATPEEAIVLKCLDEAAKEIVLNVLDTANLERNLFLTTQLIELGIYPVVSLNCFDSFTASGGSINLNKFTKLSGCNAFPTVARTGDGTASLLEHLGADNISDSAESSVLELPKVWKDAAGNALELEGLTWTTASPNQKYEALRKLIDFKVTVPEILPIKKELAKELSQHTNKEVKVTDLACQLASDRYRRVEGLIKSCAIIPQKHLPPIQEKIDRVLTHKYFGLPIFAALMGWVFWTTFYLGEIPMGWVESLLKFITALVKSNLADGLIRDLLVEGVIGGVGGVLIFIPNILILFFWIALLEDSGYMSRAAFLMDKLMNCIGLHGRAFIPMIMGLGCNVPAVMATRIIDNRAQRLLTMLLIPLITCAARLPVLVLLCGSFFPENPSKWMFILFFCNLLVLILLAQITSVFFKTGNNAPFLLEMPPYRLPTIKSVFDMLFEKGMHFIEKAGTVILAGSILIWVLSAFPREVPLTKDYDAQITQLKQLPGNEKIYSQIAELSRDKSIEQMEGRYMARIGKAIHPVMEPLGFSWRETVSLIPGFLAKESVVSTLSVLYTPFSENLGDAMKKNGMSKLSAFVFMLFTLLYIPCIATVGVIWRESGSTKFTVFASFTYVMLAYIISYMVLKIGNLLLETEKAGSIAFQEGAIILGLGFLAGWYLFKRFFTTISGNFCSGCSGCASKGKGGKPECQEMEKK